MLRPELGGGLGLRLAYRYGDTTMTSLGVYAAVMTVRNDSDHVIRRIKISLPSEVRRGVLPDIAILKCGEEFAFPVHLALCDGAEAVRSVKVELRCDQGSYASSMPVSDIDLLVPLNINTQEFLACRKRLTGFNELQKRYPRSTLLQIGHLGRVEVLHAIKHRVNSSMNVSTVHVPVEGSVCSDGVPQAEMLFAGMVRKRHSEVRVLITISSDYSGAQDTHSISLGFNCDDMVLINGLHDALKKLLFH